MEEVFPSGWSMLACVGVPTKWVEMERASALPRKLYSNSLPRFERRAFENFVEEKYLEEMEEAAQYRQTVADKAKRRELTILLAVQEAHLSLTKERDEPTAGLENRIEATRAQLGYQSSTVR
eukprot:7389139-Prymnesium_polylepis.1